MLSCRLSSKNTGSDLSQPAVARVRPTIAALAIILIHSPVIAAEQPRGDPAAKVRGAFDNLSETRKREAKARGVRVGMTQAEAMGSNWGKPKRINTTITAAGKHEQWVYGGANYLYFENGILTAIQTGP